VPCTCLQANFAASEIWEGYRECRKHRDAVKPGARLVVSMSVGSPAARPDDVVQKYLNTEFAKGDVLFFGAASNDGGQAPRWALGPAAASHNAARQAGFVDLLPAWAQCQRVPLLCSHRPGDSSLSDPAVFDAVISVASVDSRSIRSFYSNFNSKVELVGGLAAAYQLTRVGGSVVHVARSCRCAPTSILVLQAAPGEYVISTMSKSDDSRAGATAQLTLQPGLAAGVLTSPKPAYVGGSKVGQVSGEVVWCEMAKGPCQGAKGKICLIQRGEADAPRPTLGQLAAWPLATTACFPAACTGGWLLRGLPLRCSAGRQHPGSEPICCAGCDRPDCKDQYRYFCQKALHCAAGGGVGVIFYNRVDAPDCQPALGATIQGPQCDQKPDLIAVAVSKGQGLAIKAMLDRRTKVTATLSAQDGFKAPPYG
jgi:hypothetical protein